MYRILLFSFLFCLSLVLKLSAQSHIIFNHLTVNDGLSQSSVTCIFQDVQGFMWFGTQDGLNRFDGYNIKVFKNNPNDSTTLSENFVFSIYEDQSGVLFIETQSGKFHKYNPRSESFQLVDKEKLNLRNFKVSSVLAQLYESSGIIWTGGLGKGTGLERLDTKTGKKTIFKHNPADPSSISDDKVYSVYRDRSGNLWVGTFNGLDRLDELTGKFFHYRNNPDDAYSISDNWVWPIFEDSHGNLWMGTNKGGLNMFDIESKRFYNYKNDPNDPKSISDNFVFSIFEDRSGVIWVGTNLGGVNYFLPSTQFFEQFRHDPKNKNSLNDDVVYSMLVDKNGDYWIGTKNGGLNRYDTSQREFSFYTNNPSNRNSIISNTVQTLLQDKSGIIWIGTYSSGLDAYDPRTGVFTHYTNNTADTASLSDNRVYGLAEDKNGDIWVGTYGGGVNKFDRSTGKFIRYQYAENDPNSLNSNSTWSLAFDSEGKLWIGAFGSGVNILDPKTNTFQYFKNDPADSTSISDNNIIRIFKDSKGNMWIGSSKGLSRFIRETNNFKNYDENEGLSNNFIYGILEDGKGNLWLSTNDGISKFNPEKEIFKNYYYEDGLIGNEFNQNAFAKDWKTGKLLFGGPNGFNVFHPDSLKENSFKPPIVFTRYLRYNTDDEEGKPVIEKGISVRDSILLTFKDNIITLDFSALSFYNLEENQYKYKLEGFNETWIQLGNSHTITFTNLSPGEYNLRVIGSNNDGVWNEEGAKLFIEVLPPWWRTNVAYGIYAVLFISLLYGIRKFELDRREKKAQIRENMLRLKATEAEKRAIEIENERKTKELEEARQLQLSMLPKEVPVLPNLEISAFMRTATEVGGDYYDFLVQKDGVLNVAFGDATGHGLQAGTMVTLMKGFFTSDAGKLGLQEFMNHCTNMIKEIKLGRILMSFSFMRIENHKMAVTSAGMPPIYYFNNETKETEEIVIQGMPLGAMRKFNYRLFEKEIKSGDTILLLTDGLPEQMNNSEEMFDYKRVKQNFNEIAQSSPKDIIDKLITSGDQWMNGRLQDDDITFVVIKVK